VVIWSLFSCVCRLVDPHSRGASPRRRIPVSKSKKTKGGRTTMTTDPCSKVWITMSETTTKQRRRLLPDYPIVSKDATLKRKRLLCVPFNDVSLFLFLNYQVVSSATPPLAFHVLQRHFLLSKLVVIYHFSSFNNSNGRAWSHRRFHPPLRTAPYCWQASRSQVHHPTNFGRSHWWQIQKLRRELYHRRLQVSLWIVFRFLLQLYF